MNSTNATNTLTSAALQFADKGERGADQSLAKLKKFEAIQFKLSAYILPDEPLRLDRFQWFANQLRMEGVRQRWCRSRNRRKTAGAQTREISEAHVAHAAGD